MKCEAESSCSDILVMAMPWTGLYVHSVVRGGKRQRQVMHGLKAEAVGAWETTGGP